jgi:hypothetical protein
MSDLETTKAMFKRANIPFTQNKEKRTRWVRLEVEGEYIGFYTSLAFFNGKLVKVEAYDNVSGRL